MNIRLEGPPFPFVILIKVAPRFLHATLPIVVEPSSHTGPFLKQFIIATITFIIAFYK